MTDRTTVKKMAHSETVRYAVVLTMIVLGIVAGLWLSDPDRWHAWIAYWALMKR